MELFSTTPMRCIDMLVSRRRKYERYAIFSGVDNQSRDFDEFYNMITQALSLLPARLECGTELADLIPKKIIGTVFFTQVWHLPKSLEINYDRIFSVPAAFVAGEILFEVLRRHFSRHETEDEAIKRAGDIEREYIGSLLEDDLAKEDYERYRMERPATRNQRLLFMRKFMRNKKWRVKKWSEPGA